MKNSNFMHNREIKEQFLNEYYDNESTRNTVKYTFYHSSLEEMILEKDLYNFTLDEIINVIKTMKAKNSYLARNRGNIISTYISWAIKNNLRTNNIHPMQGLTTEWYDSQGFVSEDRQQYITKMEYDEMIDGLLDYQDKVVLALIFNGINGTRSSEIRNLKIDDVNEEKHEIRLFDDSKGERVVKVDEDIIEMIKRANSEEYYMNNNGNVKDHSHMKSELVPSQYVVKYPKKGRPPREERSSQTMILNRVKMLSEIFHIPGLTPKTIMRSGMLHMAHELLKGKERLTRDDFLIIADQYNFKSYDEEGKPVVNVGYMKVYINEENVNMLYE